MSMALAVRRLSRLRHFSTQVSLRSNPDARDHGPTAGKYRGDRGSSSTKSSVDAQESAKFAALSGTWWDELGPFKPLHAMNPVRLLFLRSGMCRHFKKDPISPRPLDGLTILDVGCGGGLLCEPLARMGAHVTGIDAVEENIEVAKLHAAKDPLTATILYQHTTAEQLVQEKQQFDIVAALEVIEHVPDPMDFLQSLSLLTKQDGAVVISTLNRSPTSYSLAIFAAEYILGWLPKGTHDWSKFLTPEEVALLMERASLTLEEMTGMFYDPLKQTWRLADDLSVNYIAWAAKRGE
ncbi:ubiquinone biosynthesis O-methyltransferase, mitochondrial isoform X2 [Selaginella moellendorffii]|nr:ubiquinone biosynthesis O-methyltransferase, mitochondrial isoform X2 [Selaginella moellendorffii]|eukprot:XP_002978582.2 ubiquinone biosynthesis O-methyltransferase, mitochondrial isoform X2 [Selaginella moellendorffii]